MSDTPNPSFSNVEQYLFHQGDRGELYSSICMWSDLLGFGTDFIKYNWSPPIELWSKIGGRLMEAYRYFLNHKPLLSKTFMLNDGFVHVQRIQSPKLIDVAFFIKSCIEAHIEVNQHEEIQGYPGTRSVIAFGEGLSYVHSNFYLDDFCLNYTKEKPDEISDTAKKLGNPIIAYNPSDLQMNTAFSKAYLLESLGSKAGIEGNKFYIDVSFFNFVNACIDYNPNCLKTEEEHDGVLKYMVFSDAPECKYVYFGFEMKPVNITYRGWETMVYQIQRYYPLGEPLKFNFSMLPPYYNPQLGEIDLKDFFENPEKYLP